MRNYKKIILLILLPFFITGVSLAQPKLSFSKSELNYKSIFDRLQNVYLINSGDQQLRIDTIYYNSKLYYLRFNKYYQYPFYINPGDSVLMDCIIEGYPWITAADTADTMYIMNTGVNIAEKMPIRIKFFEDTLKVGTIQGTITDGVNPITNAEIYFFLEGNYIIRKVSTNANGDYSMQLPIGRYTVGAVADSYYVSFYDNKTNPFRSNLITLKSEQLRKVNFTLNKIDYSGSSISGQVWDSLSHALLRRAILVVRKGDHTPNKIVSGIAPTISKNNIAVDTGRTYTVFLNSNGSYSIEGIKEPGYYYIQAFSDYYVPTYYSQNKTSVFWQTADSVYINTDLKDLNIYMPRDSSIGGGSISGNILTSPSSSSILNDVVVYAQSTSNSLLYNYGLAKDDGTYQITNLPYGNYDLVAQKIGLSDASAKNINITPNSFDTTGVDISFIITSVDDNPKTPNTFILSQNFPNPFNPSTKIKYTIPFVGTSFMKFVQLKIYDVLGREVATLVNQNQSPGTYEVTFDASKLFNGNIGLASGVYIYQLRVSSQLTQVPLFIASKKFVLIK